MRLKKKNKKKIDLEIKKKKMKKNQLYFKCKSAPQRGGLGVFTDIGHTLEVGRGMCLCRGCEVWFGGSAMLIGKCLWPGSFPDAKTPAAPVIPLGLF